MDPTTTGVMKSHSIDAILGLRGRPRLPGGGSGLGGPMGGGLGMAARLSGLGGGGGSAFKNASGE